MLLGVDVGGTFTDAALLDGARLITAKAPSTPHDQSEGVLAAVEAALDSAGVRPDQVERFVHGMTVGTNALLEGKVARTALIATEGFTDLEELGRQARPELYRLCAGHPPPLVPPERRIPAKERCGPDGVLTELDETALEDAIAELDVEAVAVCLLWGFRHQDHERRIAELAPDHVHVSTSHETAAVFREYERCATTVVDAALSPLLRRYLERLSERAGDAGLPRPEVMLSGGGVADAATAARHGSWTVLSGPAGGAVGAALMARAAGEAGAVCLDMGGTSCDVSVASDGRVAATGGREVGGRSLALPMVDVHTVGAGGGSIAWRDAGGALRVGPHSAGADPGPACYGLGGEEPTVTDANLLLGYLDPHSPLAGGVELDSAAAEKAVGKLADELGLHLDDTAAGIARVAGTEMARAVRVMTVERGVDPRELALLAFGGAGALHAAAIADELAMRRVLVPHASGVLSAVGLIAAERRRDLVESVLLHGDALTREAAAEVVERLAKRGREELDAPEAEIRAAYDLRYAGQAFELTVPGDERPEPDDLREAFDEAHEERYGYSDPDAPLELVTVRVAAALPAAELPRSEPGEAERRGHREVLFDGERVRTEVVSGVPEELDGPAIVELPESTLVVPPGWRATATGGGLSMERTHNGRRRASISAWPREPVPRARRLDMDPVTLQVMLGALRAACDEMGVVLVRSAHSANVKERRDASTGLFDADGQMVMQAEHIPVHLGAMPAAVAAVLDEHHSPGDAWILNDPYKGGTHLPDITVISPVFLDRELVGFSASRAHHADVGGRLPGSMPADSKTLEEEGVVIEPTRLAHAGQLDRDLLRRLTEQMRGPRQREADLRAQLAANRAGAARMTELAERHGLDTLREAMRETLDYAERRTRAAITDIDDGERHARDVLEGPDGDLELKLTATVTGDELTLDFSGSADQYDGNLNCPLAVTMSACYFAVRVLADPDVPPCAGAYRPITVTATEGSILNARPPAAVAGGNVETSSRVADLVLQAFGRALGQGTMNNLTLGNEEFAYYETLGGGQGACHDADGPSAVEALELEFPLRAIEYSVRRGSGGKGRHRGGDGVVREVEALEEMTYSLITERRRHRPKGAEGGESGAAGRNLVNGEEVPAKAAGTLRPGDRLRIETPGGGGHGEA
jgi:5-oxoprolinase (ATP-hydrolysing)